VASDSPDSKSLMFRRHGRAQSRARQRLVEAHRVEFTEYLELEKAKEGIRTLRSRQVAQ
jgi:hypothetical protein